MRRGAWIAAALVLLVIGVAGSVGAVNLVQTAKVNHAGRVSFTFASGLVQQNDPDTVWYLTPQVRVAILQQRPRLFEVQFNLAVVRVAAHHLLQFRILPRQVAEAVLVSDHIAVAE